MPHHPSTSLLRIAPPIRSPLLVLSSLRPAGPPGRPGHSLEESVPASVYRQASPARRKHSDRPLGFSALRYRPGRGESRPRPSQKRSGQTYLPSCGRRRSATHIHRCCSCSRHNIDDGVIVAGSSRAQYRGNAQLTLGKSPGALGMRWAKASRCPSTSPGRTNGSAFLCADPTRAYAIVRLSTIAQAPRRELDYEPDAAEATFFRSTWLSACLRVSIVTPLPFNSTMNRSGTKTRIVPDLLSLSYSSTPLKPL